MKEFVEYLLQEFEFSDEAVFIATSFSHSTKTKIDEISKVPITKHIITVNINCFNKYHQQYASISEKFVNGKIKRPKKKPLKNISPEELNDKFAKAKDSICSDIQRKYDEKIREVNYYINKLKEYCGSELSNNSN